MRAAWMMSLLLCAGLVQAGIYKTYDKNGNVVFTDVPSADAKEVQTREVTTVPALPRTVIDQKLKPDAKTAQADAEPAAYQITLNNPKPDSTLQSATPAFPIDVQLQPRLWKEHHLQIWLDGKLLTEDNFHTPLDPAQLERGQHRLQIKIINKQKKEIGSSTADFFVQQPSALNRKH